MRVIVCGGRDYNNESHLVKMLDAIHEKYHFTDLMHGGASGADRLAGEWAKTKFGIKRYVCRAEWEKYARHAGPKRNARMMEWKPDMVVAFPGGRGTADMVTRAKAANVEVLEVN